MNFSRISLGVLVAALVILAAPAIGVGQTAPGAAPLPSASPTSLPRRGKRARPAPSGSPSAAPSETPEPPQFTTLDGTWEFEIQPDLARLPDYSFMTIAVNGANLTGSWQHGAKRVQSPMVGTFDGRLISMTVTLADGSTATFSGYVEDFDNMVGMYRLNGKDPGTAFTGEHRKRQRG